MNGPVGRRMRLVRRVAGLAVFALLVGGGGIYLFGGPSSTEGDKPAFSGEMRIRPGETQRLAFHPVAPDSEPASPDPGQGPIYRSVPGEDIVATYPELARNWLEARLSYDVANLPFEVHLNTCTSVTIPLPRDTIHVDGPGGASDREVREGDQASIGGVAVTVSEIRRWSGLLDYTDGAPMTELSLRVGGEDWLEHLFIASGNWLLLDEGVALRFVHCPDEAAMNAAVEAGLPGDECARWGLVQGDEVHWLESLVPGTGVEADNGTIAMLLEYEPAGADENGRPLPAIRVAVRDGDKVSRDWYSANAESKDSPIRFLYPAHSARVLLVHAVADENAMVTAFRNGERVGGRSLAPGEAWPVDGTDMEVRLDGLSTAALPVVADNSTLFEAILTGADRRWRVREGEPTWVGENVVKFERNCEPPQVEMALAIHDDDTDTPIPFVLGPGDSYTYKNWTFKQGTQDWRDRNKAIVVVEYR